ncbi:MAG: ribosome silencing factor [Clostridia bacterium]|nr:ribosome silencing factor [Clostridia bacterium]
MNKKAETAIKALDKKKAIDIKAIRIGDLTVMAEMFVIAAGTSGTHVRALADEVEFQMEQAGFTPRQIEGKATGWILLDYHDVIVHVFTPDQRENYSLEKLWADGEEVDISELVTE